MLERGCGVELIIEFVMWIWMSVGKAEKGKQEDAKETSNRVLCAKEIDPNSQRNGSIVIERAID
eukprot:scaffold8938_cov124-Skeletonema_dohrnii-CCMP3373.AAC.3